MTSPSRGNLLLAMFTLFLLSGATSLVYQVLWLRQLILIFGSTQFATSTVLSTFMAGLALGAFVAGRKFRGSAMHPLAVYGWLEIGIGIYALIVPFLFRSLSPIYQVIWDAGAADSFVILSLAKFAGIALVLLPPTILMGASLPVLARQVADDPARIGGKVGGLYAINTIGAVCGVFIAGFLAIPHIGMQATLFATAGTNLALGVVAIWVSRRSVVPSIQPRKTATESSQPAVPSGRVKLALVAFGVSGFGALVLEVAWTRVLALVMGSSVYAFSLMLLAFLVGLAFGSAWFSRYLRKRPQVDPGTLLAVLLGSAGLLAWATAFLFPQLPRLFAWIFFSGIEMDPGRWFFVQFGLGLLIMFPATMALGGIFPTMLQLHARELEGVSGSVGTVYASNTVGTILGAGLAGFVLIPTFGVLNTVIAVAVIEMLLGILIAIAVTRRRKPILIGGMIVLVLLMAFLRPGWDVRLMNSGVYMNLFDVEGDTPRESWENFLKAVHQNNVPLYAEEGYTASVFVAEQPDFGNRYLSVNGKIEASTSSDVETQIMCAHLPLLFHDDPKDIMIIGLASAITVGAAATHPVESIRVVEVEKKMIPAARLFAEYNDHVLDDERLEISINDARNELEFSSRTYDVLISEPSNPWMTVAANLFTEDFFEMAKTRVRPHGIFAQWIQNYYLPEDDLRSIVAAFHKSFPHVVLFETFGGVDLILLGAQEPIDLNMAELEQRMNELNVRMSMGRAEIRRPTDVLAMLRLGPDEIDEFVRDAPRNTDDNARVEFSAPKALGSPTLAGNIKLLRSFAIDPVLQVSDPLADDGETEALRLDLAYSYYRRGEYALARRQLDQIGDKLAEQVTGLREQIARYEDR